MVPGQLVARVAACAALALGMAASLGAAQSRITPDQFLDRAVGYTLRFELLGTGQLVGTEEFLRRDLTVWKPRGQACVYGAVTVEDGALCFLYDNEEPEEKSCWYTFDLGGRLMVRGLNLFDAEIQVVTQMSEAPISCPNAPTS